MPETFIINLSPRGPDESGEHTECAVAVDLNLIRWLLDLGTQWLSLKLARFIHFMLFMANPLPDS